MFALSYINIIFQTRFLNIFAHGITKDMTNIYPCVSMVLYRCNEKGCGQKLARLTHYKIEGSIRKK